MDFYTYLSRSYEDLFPPNQKQENFLVKHLPQSGAVLDVGAGTGGYAAALSRAGARVEALEIGSMYPRLAERASQGGFKALELGMEQVSALPAAAYGMVYCIGNTLVHLSGLSQVTAFLTDCRRLLFPGGCLILQIVNYDRVMGLRQDALPVIERPEKALRLERHYDLGQGTVRFITTLHAGGETWTSENTLLALSRSELEDCLKKAGYPSVAFFGDFEGAVWNEESPATIAVAHP